MNERTLNMVLVGAGERGTFSYGQAALDGAAPVRFVAVAEPDGARRDRFASMHGIPPARRFSSWRELLSAGQIAPALLCCTMDRDHVDPTVAALVAGYDVLLEKPMSVSAEGCARMVEVQERTGKLLMLCHVLRFAPFFATLHEIISSGRLGQIVAVEHRENVAYWHMAHSYVRGNWRNSAGSSPMILAKCCHDLDQLVWNLERDPVRRVHSFGSLLHFRPENAPDGAPLRCTDGCPVADECPYYAPRTYLGENLGWPTEMIAVDLSYESRLLALQTGPYGRCVYHSDNTVVDHQVVSMEHESGATTTLVMHGHSDEEERTMRYDGTRGTLRGRTRHGGESEIAVTDHRTGTTELITIPEEGGHGGGDARLLRAFAQSVRSGQNDTLTSARVSLESHLLAFAAERSRLSGSVVDMPAYRAEIESSVSRDGISS